MDKLKRTRRPLRMIVTKSTNEAETELKRDVPDVSALRDLLDKLEETTQKLFQLDEQIMDVLVDSNCDDETQDAESAEVEKYADGIRRIKRMIKEVLNPLSRSSSPAMSLHSINSTTTDSRKKSYKLPKTEIKKFGGEITEWIGWWAQFAKIHEDEELHDSDKFQYLVQAMETGSKAAELVKVYPQSSENYPKVIDALKERFGKEKILKRVYVRELLKMIIKNSKEKVEISQIFDKLEGHLKALESLGISHDQMDILLFPMVESCLPEDILLAWQRSPSYGKDGKNENPPKTEFEYMMEFVKVEVENEVQRTLAKSGFGTLDESTKKNQSKKYKVTKTDDPTAASLLNQGVEGCIFCGKNNHVSQECFKARNLTLEEKKAKVTESRRCLACFKTGHFVKFCKSGLRCPFCGRKHYALMCPDAEKNKSGDKEIKKVTSGVQDLQVQHTVTNYSQGPATEVVLMQTLHVLVKGSQGQSKEVRLLFDSGSQRSYIKSQVAEESKCPVIESITMQNAVFGGYTTGVKTRSKYGVTLLKIGSSSRIKRKVNLIGEDVICTYCPTVPQGPWIEKLTEKGIFLTDTKASSPEIQILIGSDLMGSLITGKVVKIGKGLVAFETLFGWTLSGEVQVAGPSTIAMTTISMLTQEDQSISNLWKLEVLGIRDTAEKISEEEHGLQVKLKLQTSIQREENGRYVVSLPWVTSHEGLPSNRAVSEKRLISATEKLIKHGMYQTYDNIFNEWEKEGIIVEDQDGSSSEHFLPHRPVFKPQSLTTPVRPVFDA